ncbi:MAG TPA: c-type cytochrome, partial [Gemmatimonadaceae bacterium]|nr:c-type cytochrome [Gemmatimonadaceae bacterium]
WSIARRGGAVLRRFTDPNPTYTFTRPGIYVATLTVTDSAGASATARTQIAAGNEPPKVAIDLTGNHTFYFPGVPVRYAVSVTDREDDSLRTGRIAPARVAVSASFSKEGLPAPQLDAGHRAPAVQETFAEGKRLIEAGTCLSCHQISRASIGPSYTAVSRKYRGDSTALAHLADKIRGGGSGVWGKVMMPPHPQLTEDQARQMASYILSLGQPRRTTPTMPTRGAYTPPAASDSTPRGVVMLRAAYTDRGANGVPAVTAETTLVLRSPRIVVATGVLGEGAGKAQAEGIPVDITVANRSGGSVKLEKLDLTSVSAINFLALAPARFKALGGTIEVRIDSASGPLLGRTDPIVPNADSTAPPHVFRVPLTPTAGVHDVHLVFRNEQAQGEGLLFGVLTAAFESAAPPAETRGSRSGRR